ncbi:MAG: SIR2 family protein [Cyclobacteriaceae bacterium]
MPENNSINTNFDQFAQVSQNNLAYLAEELVRNYVASSSIDLYPPAGTLFPTDGKMGLSQEYIDNKLHDITPQILKEYNKRPPKDLFSRNPHSKENGYYSRNILVIGAGCTSNVFPDIPLGEESWHKVYQGFELKVHSKKNWNNPLVLTMDDIVDFILAKETAHASYYDELKKTSCRKEQKQIEQKQAFLTQVFSSSNNNDRWHKENLIKSMGEQFLEEYQKLNLYGQNINEHKFDFETALSLLEKFVPKSKIRDRIQHLYNHRHGPSLFYELVAHLFKNRFIDVIINFNFDEFLDQAIEDEIGKDGYDIILSDGDCRPIEDLQYHKKLRQPLYIKPHGTAKHKSTLRFTKNQYYELPADMRKLIEDVVCAKMENEKNPSPKYVNLITAGFEMESIEFNDILVNHLPEHSNVFSFFYHNNQEIFTENEKNYRRRCDTLNEKIKNKLDEKSKGNIFFYLIGHEFPIKKEATCLSFEGDKNTLNTKLNQADSKKYGSLGSTFVELYKMMGKQLKEPFYLPNINRHELIVNLFGNTSFWNVAGKQNEKTGISYPGSYFETADYLKDRTLIEILMTTTYNKGRIDPPLLMEGRAGKYYAEYADKEKGDLSSMASLIEYCLKKEVVHFKPLDINKAQYLRDLDISPFFDEILESFSRNDLNQKFSKTFVKYMKNTSDKERKIIKGMFEKLWSSKKSKVHSKLRSPIPHVFQKYHLSDLINTELTTNLHYYESICLNKINEIYIVADFGTQIRRFIKYIEPRLLNDAAKDQLELRVILIDRYPNSTYEEKQQKALESFLDKSLNDEEKKERVKRLMDRIKIKFLGVNRHNHHMTIFLKTDTNGIPDFSVPGINRAIYYYQQGLSHEINPMRIFYKENIEYLRAKFQKYWNRSFIKTPRPDLFGKALRDHFEHSQNGMSSNDIKIKNSINKDELKWPCREAANEPNDWEKVVLNECRGRVLEVGSALGRLTTILEESINKGVHCKGNIISVTPMESSPNCIKVIYERKLLQIKETLNEIKQEDIKSRLDKIDYPKIITQSFEHLQVENGESYDTILIPDAIKLAGDIPKLKSIIEKALSILQSGGQIILLIKRFTNITKGEIREIKYQFEYNNEVSYWFDWTDVTLQKLQSEISKSQKLKDQISSTIDLGNNHYSDGKIIEFAVKIVKN